MAATILPCPVAWSFVLTGNQQIFGNATANTVGTCIGFSCPQGTIIQGATSSCCKNINGHNGTWVPELPTCILENAVNIQIYPDETKIVNTPLVNVTKQIFPDETTTVNIPLVTVLPILGILTIVCCVWLAIRFYRKRNTDDDTCNEIFQERIPSVSSLAAGALSGGVTTAYSRQFRVVTDILTDSRFGLDKLPRGSVHVAVLDSGMWTGHKAFQSLMRVPTNIVHKDYVNDPTDRWDHDVHNHGTGIAGVIAGDVYYKDHVNNVDYRGLAPFAKLVISKVADKNGAVSANNITQALNDLNNLDAHGSFIDIVNISLGGKFDNETERQLLRDAMHNATAKRIVICTPSNDGMLDSDTILYPAAFGSCICVGSHDDAGNRSRFSAVGQHLDFLGPGEKIPVCDSSVPNNPTNVASRDGTSFAAPYVAGLTAQLLVITETLGERQQPGLGKTLRKRLTNTETMKRLLKKMSTKKGHNTKSGFGLLNPAELLHPPERFLPTVQQVIN